MRAMHSERDIRRRILPRRLQQGDAQNAKHYESEEEINDVQAAVTFYSAEYRYY